jgi:hypothetical protein
MILKNESPEIINIEFLSLAMDFVMLMNYFYMRVWTLGNSLWINTNDKIQVEFFTKYPISLFYFCSVLLWVLQVTWFLYLAVGLYKKLLWPLQTRKEI